MGSNPTGVRDFFSVSVLTHFLSIGLLLRSYYLGYLEDHFNLPHLNHYICLVVLSGQTLQVTPHVFKVVRCVHGTGTRFIPVRNTFVIPRVDIGLRTEIIFPNLRAIISLYLFNNTDRFRSGTNNSV